LITAPINRQNPLPRQCGHRARQFPGQAVDRVTGWECGAVFNELRYDLALGGVAREFYETTCIPNFRTPMVVGFAQDQINRMIQRGREISIADLLAESAREV
jgi:hypothetical protein